jgi:hypothetical protein
MTCRIQIDLAFESDASDRLTRPGAQAAHDALVAAIAAARPFAVWPVEGDDAVRASRHVCAHPGGPCPQPTEIGVRPVKKIAAVSIIEGIEP